MPPSEVRVILMGSSFHRLSTRIIRSNVSVRCPEMEHPDTHSFLLVLARPLGYTQSV